eukprot:tig00001537_g9297.t1
MSKAVQQFIQNSGGRPETAAGGRRPRSAHTKGNVEEAWTKRTSGLEGERFGVGPPLPHHQQFAQPSNRSIASAPPGNLDPPFGKQYPTPPSSQGHYPGQGTGALF